MTDDDLPLFNWQSADCLVITFPLVKQTGKIRDVAAKLLDKRTDRHADYYRSQVSDALIRRLCRLSISEREQDEQIGAFWRAVELEVARLTYRGQRPGGAA